jgi:amino acid permease
MYTAIIVAYVVIACFLLWLSLRFRAEEKLLYSAGKLPDYPPIWWGVAFAVTWPLTLPLAIFMFNVIPVISRFFSKSDRDDERVETGKIIL